MHDDFLGKAAESGHKAKIAIKEKDFDSAWRDLHLQKEYYLKHAKKYKFTQKQALALDACVHEYMANICRMEGRHEDAFIDILYWVIAQSERPKKSHKSKLKSYFSRCKFKIVQFEDVERFTQMEHELPDFFTARNKILEWHNIESKA